MRYELLAQQTSPVNLSSTEEIAVPLRSADAIIADLTQTRVNLSSARSMTDRLAGQLQAIGDPAILQASAAQLSDEISRLETEYTSIRLAMDDFFNCYLPAAGHVPTFVRIPMAE